MADVKRAMGTAQAFSHVEMGPSTERQGAALKEGDRFSVLESKVDRMQVLFNLHFLSFLPNCCKPARDCMRRKGRLSQVQVLLSPTVTSVTFGCAVFWVVVQCSVGGAV
jgi:hypothetical protein